MASTVRTDKVGPVSGSADFILPTADGTVGQFLKTDGSLALGFATVASTGFEKYTVVTSTDATFDLQTGTTKLIIEVQSAGGTAGSNSGTGYEGGSGGTGSYAKKFLTGLTGATDKLNITIGAVAGAGGSGTTTSVAQAGTASFTTVTCTGGGGGVTAGGSAHGAGGAFGAIPTTGDLNIAGVNGMGGAQINSRKGSDSMLGFGGRFSAVTASTAGGAATGYGGGGGAGIGASSAGGAGSLGVVIVWEYK